MRRELYRPDWEATSLRIRKRSGGRCECRGEMPPRGCGLHRGRRCVERNGQPGKWMRGKVTLTCHHKDGCKTNDTNKNLGAFCNRCHLRADQPIREERRKLARDRAAGQTRLPGMEPLEERP